jgi:hypothetical protein
MCRPCAAAANRSNSRPVIQRSVPDNQQGTNDILIQQIRAHQQQEKVLQSRVLKNRIIQQESQQRRRYQ